MIVVLTNADTEILALRSVLEGLPAGFPRVRAANPAALDGPPGLGGVEAVLVRLLGGRRAWEAGFDELRRRCVEAGVPLLAFGARVHPAALGLRQGFSDLGQTIADALAIDPLPRGTSFLGQLCS